MNYIQANLQPGEEIKYSAKLHIFLFLQPVVLIAIGWWLTGSEAGVLHFGGWFLIFVGVVSLIQRIMVKMGSVYVVTNKRVILKTGIVRRRATDLMLTKCEGLHIKQSVLGRIFNYGTITVSTAGSLSSYPFIANPLAFRKEINAQIG